jgi:hypothetical protein
VANKDFVFPGDVLPYQLGAMCQLRTVTPHGLHSKTAARCNCVEGLETYKQHKIQLVILWPQEILTLFQLPATMFEIVDGSSQPCWLISTE